MVIGRLRPDKKTKYGTKSGRPRAPPMGDTSDARTRSRSRHGRPSNSLLEQLPTELLQDIFLFSANTNLPLCSKQLLGALTSEHLKFEFTLQILVYQRHELEQEDKSILLTRRFFTWDFVVRYVSFAHTRVAAAVDDSSSDDGVDSDEDEGYAATERSTSRPPSRQQKPQGPSPSLYGIDLELTALARNGIAELRRDEIGHLLEINAGPTLELDKLLRTQSLQGLQDLDLPEKLLHNGWADDRLRLLRLLITFNCTVSRSSPAGAAADEGIMEAITQDDEEMVSYFLGAHIGVDPDIDMLREAMKGTNVSIIFQLLRSSHGQLDHLDHQVWKLLDEHLEWGKREKATVKRWLQKGVRDPVAEEDTEYLPRLRDIEVDGRRWAIGEDE